MCSDFLNSRHLAVQWRMLMEVFFLTRCRPNSYKQIRRGNTRQCAHFQKIFPNRFFTVDSSSGPTKTVWHFFSIMTPEMSEQTITAPLFAQNQEYENNGLKKTVTGSCTTSLEMNSVWMPLPVLQLLCKKNAISSGRKVERYILVNRSVSRLRGKFTNICEAGLQCKMHCQGVSLQSEFFEFKERYVG